jgi:hypothetical protein
MQDTPTMDAGLGIHAAELPTESLAAGRSVVFTWHDADGHWRAANFTVVITG